MGKGNLNLCCEGWVGSCRKVVYNTLDTAEICESQLIAMPTSEQTSYDLYWASRSGTVKLIEKNALSYPRNTILVNGPTFVLITPGGAYLCDGFNSVLLSLQIESN